MLKSVVKILCVLLLLLMSGAVMCAKDFTIVIDAGHGGRDFGAIGKTSREKDINLAVALELGRMINKNMPDVKVVYTRDKDVFVTLQGRADIANKANGDLFVSIHTNSVDLKVKDRAQRRGASTYTLGIHKNDDNLEVAKRENSVISLENNAERYEGFDPNSTESYIIFEINQNRHVERSLKFASQVQKEFVRTAGRVDKSVRQAGFWVLAKTSMPAVLLELDFICNPTEEQFLSSEPGQKRLAKAIYNAFAQYRESTPAKDTSEVDNAVTPSAEQSVVEQPVITEDKATPVYKIQFMVSDKKLSTTHRSMKGLENVSMYRENGQYKYTYGTTTSRTEAVTLLKFVRKKFKDAFIVTFEGNKRIK